MECSVISLYYMYPLGSFGLTGVEAFRIKGCPKPEKI
jgi:hypothetical protein